MIIATLLVRDEEEIVEECILHHLNNGVDKIIATDNASTDKTNEILQKYVSDIIYEPELNYEQGKWVSRMAKLSCKYNPTWIVHIDADEFWYGLKNLYLFPDSVGVIYLPDHYYNHIPSKDMPSNFFKTSLEPYYVKAKSCGRLIHRPSENVVVHQGNHKVDNVPGEVLHLKNDIICMHHYTFRSYEHYEKKIIQGGMAYEQYSGPKGDGIHWRNHYRIWKENNLRKEYNEFLMDQKKKEMIEKGEGGIAYYFL